MDRLFTDKDFHRIIESLRDELYSVAKNKEYTNCKTLGASIIFEKLLKEYNQLTNYYYK